MSTVFDVSLVPAWDWIFAMDKGPLLDWAALALPIVLSVVGVFVTVETPKLESQTSKNLWRGGLVIFGIMASVVVWFQQKAARNDMAELKAKMPQAADIANELKGKKSICYWYAVLEHGNSDGTFPRILTNTGASISMLWWHVYVPGTDEFSEEYKNNPFVYLDGILPCPSTGIGIVPRIKPGKYAIDFTGFNDNSLAINNDDDLPNARPNAFSKSLRQPAIPQRLAASYQPEITDLSAYN